MTPYGAWGLQPQHLRQGSALASCTCSLRDTLYFPEEKPGSKAEQPLLGENKANAVGRPFLGFLISKGMVSSSLHPARYIGRLLYFPIPCTLLVYVPQGSTSYIFSYFFSYQWDKEQGWAYLHAMLCVGDKSLRFSVASSSALLKPGSMFLSISPRNGGFVICNLPCVCC